MRGICACYFFSEVVSEKRVGWQVQTLTGHSDGVLSVAFSPKGDRIVSGSSDNLIKIWDAETGAEVGSSVGERCV